MASAYKQPATTKQVDYLNSLAQKAGLGDHWAVGQITKQDASLTIHRLKGLIDAKKRRNGPMLQEQLDDLYPPPDPARVRLQRSGS